MMCSKGLRGNFLTSVFTRSALDGLHLEPGERTWLSASLERFDYVLSLEDVWCLMDDVWDELGCVQSVMDERVEAFYAHTVWLLNGLYIEEDEESIGNRRVFSDWVATQTPARVADIGGGFGTLARLIGTMCPNAEIEILEPHPHPAAIEESKANRNVRFVTQLVGHYDVLLATDVFEHIRDPLSLVESTARHLREGGQYLIANCFWPVIKCHLPETFHFRHSWCAALNAMGLEPGSVILYGRAFTRRGELVLERARAVEWYSRRIFPWLELLPGRLRRPLSKILFRARVR